MLVEPSDRGLKDVCCGYRSVGLAPTSCGRVSVECGLGLRTRQAELSSVAGVPCGRVPAEDSQPFGDLGLGQPIDVALASDDRFYSLLPDELRRSRAVLADMTKQREGIA